MLTSEKRDGSEAAIVPDIRPSIKQTLSLQRARFIFNQVTILCVYAVEKHKQQRSTNVWFNGVI